MVFYGIDPTKTRIFTLWVEEIHENAILLSKKIERCAGMLRHLPDGETYNANVKDLLIQNIQKFISQVLQTDTQ